MAPSTYESAGHLRVTLPRMRAPLVSAVIPTRNRLELVRRAIASVRSQSYPNVEIIVVDDGSTDGTAETLSNEEDVRLVRLHEGLGGAGARNRGVEAATGDLIAFLDSDDEWLPEKLTQQVPRLLDQPDVGAVYSRHYSHDDETGVRTEVHSNLYTGDITEQLFSGRCPRTVSLFTVRREALEEVGGFDENLPGFQDTDLWIRIAERWQFDAVDAPLTVVHNHSGSRVTTDASVRERAVDEFLSRWGSEMTARIGSQGVRRYRRNQLAVAQGSAVLGEVRDGNRTRAVRELVEYLRIAGLSNPRQLAGLMLAIAAGAQAHTNAKARRQRKKN
jgi:glycosyltransferase involved in cell wall biosynthesis